MTEAKSQPNYLVHPRAGRAAEDIALTIEAAIMDGRLNPGDRLPSEREMLAQFGTGRGVVREAIKMLKQKGLLEVRKGAKGGAFVRQIEMVKVSESLSIFLKQHPLPAEAIIEFREVFDRAITVLAIARASQEQKEELLNQSRRLESLLRTPDPDLAVTGELDRELNVKLATMSGNPLYQWVMNALQMGFGSQDDALYEDKGFRARAAANWSDTAQAIADGEPMRALSFIGRHYVLLRQCVEAKDGVKESRPFYKNQVFAVNGEEK